MRTIVALVVGALLVVMAGCAGDDPGRAADCDVLIRHAGTQYRSVTVTDREPAATYATVEVSRCEDIGVDASGAVFGDDPDRGQAWMFEGYRGEVVLGVRLGASWQVFVEESVPQDERERIVAALS